MRWNTGYHCCKNAISILLGTKEKDAVITSYQRLQKSGNSQRCLLNNALNGIAAPSTKKLRQRLSSLRTHITVEMAEFLEDTGRKQFV
jgi:hypothetical protein